MDRRLKFLGFFPARARLDFFIFIISDIKIAFMERDLVLFFRSRLKRVFLRCFFELHDK